jgi:hypothetical protein
MGYVETILEPGEGITYRGYLHWIIYGRGIVLILIGGMMCLATEKPTQEPIGLNRITSDLAWPVVPPEGGN